MAITKNSTSTSSLPIKSGPCFDDDDPRNPLNFSWIRKTHIEIAGILCTFNGALGSSLPSGAATYIREYFDVGSHTEIVLLNSLYLVGYAIGPLLFGPLSEYAGRRPVLVGAYIGYAMFTLGCALSPNYTALLIFRLLCGLNVAAPNAVLAGLYADIHDDPRKRGRAMAICMYVTIMGPLIGPILSGFISVVSWRWTFWLGLILAGVGLPVVLLLPETFAPVLLEKMEDWSEESEEPKEELYRVQSTRSVKTLGVSLKTIFTRPFVMTVKEPILLFTSLYLALVYGVFYLFFQAYPIVFQGIYGLSPGIAGLAFIPVMVGCTVGFVGFFGFESYYVKAGQASEAWTKIEEYRRLPLACAGASPIVIALFWLGWSSFESVNPVLPMMSGVFFGAGYVLIFIGMLNYLTDFYKQDSASAQAAAATIRAIAGVCLPLATTPMYDRLGVQWTCSLLGFLALAMVPIPFVFIKFRDSIRGRSSFSRTAR